MTNPDGLHYWTKLKLIHSEASTSLFKTFTQIHESMQHND